MTIDVVRSTLLGGVPHGFLGRRGGVSSGIYASLNVGLGSSDDLAAVVENRRRAVAAAAPGHVLITAHQVHSATAIAVTDAPGDEDRPHADALATDRPGLALGILTADCVPVLFADLAAGIVGAAHAGWKGAIGGVTDACLSAMEVLGADRTRIAAAIGPCIARASYEVDDSFRTRFEVEDSENERFFQAGRRLAHHQFDIEAYVVHRLGAAGVRQVEALGMDTYANADRFFSYRRATHRGEADYGRHISLISVPE